MITEKLPTDYIRIIYVDNLNVHQQFLTIDGTVYTDAKTQEIYTLLKHRLYIHSMDNEQYGANYRFVEGRPTSRNETARTIAATLEQRVSKSGYKPSVSEESNETLIVVRLRDHLGL